jgi:hypothetical protein
MEIQKQAVDLDEEVFGVAAPAGGGAAVAAAAQAQTTSWVGG